jgi:cell division protein FtsZ
VHGLVNVDFADVRTIMSEQGMALMGTGRASGARRALEAMQAAISSPLLEDVTLDGATGLLVNITGGPGLTLHEVNEAVSMAQNAADPDANIIFGSVVDESLVDEVKITVIATGFQARDAQRARPAAVQVQVPQAIPAAVARPAATVGPRPIVAPATRPAIAPAPATAPVQAASADPRKEPPVPIRLQNAVVRAPAARRDPGPYRDADEDQFDIPAFLRRGKDRE